MVAEWDRFSGLNRRALGERFDLLGSLPQDVQHAFSAAAKPRAYAAGQIIYSQSDVATGMFRVARGLVRASYLRDDGQELIHTFFHPGQCFGVSSLIDDEPLPQMAEAQEPTELACVSRQSFDRLRSTYRAFDHALAHDDHGRVLADDVLPA